jgi:dTDP-4-dehydrorhamnose reductase
MSRVLVVGAGFVGRAIAAELRAAGDRPVLASRHPVRDGVPWLPLDVTDAAACRETVVRARPDAIVAVHGPSDVTWCEAHPERAARAHRDASRNLARAAGTRRLVLISTDNVFDGAAEANDEAKEPAPANAYGRAKLAAEAALAALPNATVLRTSLIYGPQAAERPGRLNFAAACVERLRARQPVEVPDPQWTTPVHLDDVAAITRAAIDGAPPLLHLGGPDRISRLEWARRLAERLGAAPELVVAVPKAASAYACRPTSSCLTSRLLPGLLRGWRLRVRGVDEGCAEPWAAG